jgi:Putative adhesin
MKAYIVVTTLLVAVLGTAHGQEYKVAKSTGKLDISEVNHVTIEGYAGNEIVFSSRQDGRDDDDRAKGLRAVSALGLEDNSGIGLSVVDKGTVIEVRQLKKTDGPEVKIMVPKGVAISFSHTSPYGSDVKLKNVEGAVEITTVHNGVYLDNVTGPLEVNTVHGEIEASFAAGLKNAVSLTSVHGHVDAGVPVASKINVKLSTVYGEIFVDPDLKIDIEKSGNMVKYSDKVSGKINGGGLDFTLSSTHNNVYLRKK